MTIVTTINRRTVFGDMRIVFGSSTISGGTNTGDVVTGLSGVELFVPVTENSAQKGISVNESMPLASGDVTIIMESNDGTFSWMAIGKK